MAIKHDEIFDKDGNVREHIHYEHHVWVHEKKTDSEKREQLYEKVKTSLITAIVLGSVFSLFGVLWWAIVKFIQSGGQV